jgi:hypothetical protein
MVRQALCGVINVHKEAHEVEQWQDRNVVRSERGESRSKCVAIFVENQLLFSLIQCLDCHVLGLKGHSAAPTTLDRSDVT